MCNHKCDAHEIKLGWPIENLEGKLVCPSCYGDDAFCACGGVLPARQEGGQCAACVSANAFEAEFERVFGSCNVYDGHCADGWTEPVKYDAAKALPVLARFDDGHGATERGDAEVCVALEAAGAVLP